MSISCQTVMDALERLAPARLAESWDNIGLLVGSPDQPVSGIVVALDVDFAAIEFALSCGANLIVSHHPVIFKGITSLRHDTPQGKLLCRLIENRMAVIAVHTNLDSAQGGVNDALAAAIGLEQVHPLQQNHVEKLYKLAVYVPEQQLELVRAALGDAGAGHLGVYSHCSFSTRGEGTFLPLQGAIPFIGQQGTLERVNEYKIETIVSETIRRQVIEAMLAVHPYEEVAYDLYALEDKGPANGLGRIGVLSQSMQLSQFAARVKECLQVSTVKLAGHPDAIITTAAVCGGSGAEFITQAAEAGADVFITGDVKYHEAQQAVARGLALIDAGHFATEYPVLAYLARYLSNHLKQEKPNIPVTVAPARDISWFL